VEVGENKNKYKIRQKQWELLGKWKGKGGRRIRRSNSVVNLIKMHCIYVWIKNETLFYVQLICTLK
jgi:hypothetical protein